MYAKQISRLTDTEKSDLLRSEKPDGSLFVAFLYHTLLPHGSHSRPMTFDQLASKYPQALILT